VIHAVVPAFNEAGNVAYRALAARAVSGRL